MAVITHVNLWFLCAMVPASLATTLRMDDIQPHLYAKDTIVTLLVQEMQDLKGKLEIVEGSQRKEVEDFKGVVAAQKKEIEDLKGIVTAQRKEVGDLKNVVTVQGKEFEDLKGAVSVQKEEFEKLKGVVTAQRGVIQNLEGVIYEQRHLGQGPFEVSNEQDKTMETIEVQLNDTDIYEDKESAKLSVHTNPIFDDKNVSFVKAFRGTGYDVTFAADKETAVRHGNSNNDKESDVRGDQERSVSPAGNPMARGQISRGIRETPEVAFSAYLSHNLFNMSIGHTVKLDQTILNDGLGYNSHTGIFTAPVSGVYLFTYTIRDFGVSGELAAVQLVVDDVHKVEAEVVPISGHPDMASNTAILRVSAGQAVWLQTFSWDDADLQSSGGGRYVTFSGVLLY